jgi:carboxylesterase
MRPLAEALATAGFTVDLPLLPGHGTAVDDLVPMRWDDWTGAAEAHFQALAARCDSVLVVGLSMGGALTCWLAERHPHLAGIALVNPLVHPPGDDLRSMIRGMLDAGETTTDGIGGDIKKDGVTELGYDRTPLAAILSTFDGADGVEAGLGGIHCPVLLLTSRDDHLIDAASGDAVEAGARGPVERVWLEDSYHVATLDNDAPVIESRVVAFARAVLGGPTGATA